MDVLLVEAVADIVIDDPGTVGEIAVACSLELSRFDAEI